MLKANKNNNKQKIWWLYLTNFYIQIFLCKEGMYFSFDFGLYSIYLDIDR